jgi:hypothetical protein
MRDIEQVGGHGRVSVTGTGEKGAPVDGICIAKQSYLKMPQDALQECEARVLGKLGGVMRSDGSWWLWVWRACDGIL